MSMSVKKQQAFLQVLVTSTRKQVLALIKTMNNQQLNAICEILINIRYGNVPVNDAVKKKLQRKKNIIWELTSKSTGTKLSKTLIEKEVGLIVYIVKLILPQLKTIVQWLQSLFSYQNTSMNNWRRMPHQRMEIYQHHYHHHNIPDNNDTKPDLSHNNQLGPDNSNTDDDNDDYDVYDVLESFNSTELKYVQLIITLMKINTDVLTWSRKTAEIVFLQKLVQDSNVIELLTETLTANLHPVGKMEFYRGLDMLKVKLSCIKHPKYKGLLTILKGDQKIVNKKSKKSVNHKNVWISWV